MTIALALLALVAPCVQIDGGSYPSYDTATMMSFGQSEFSKSFGRSLVRDGASPTARKSRAGKAQAARTLLYTPSRARTRANVAGFAAKMAKADPKGAAAMKRLFAGTDVMASLGAALKPLGLVTNDIGDAYTVWATTAWLAAEGRSDPTRAEVQGVRSQVRGVMLRSPEIARMTDVQRQEFAEVFLIQAMLADAAVEAAKADPSLMAPMRAAVTRGAKASGLDLAAMTLTDAGFRPR